MITEQPEQPEQLEQPWIKIRTKTQVKINIIEFDEPHPCGGNSRVRVTKEAALNSQKELLKIRGVDLSNTTDEEILLQFIACNYGRLKKLWATVDETGRVIL